jgi:tyrosine-protein kinase Etk/Wzc
MALAMAGERVLLIDADLRRSSLHKVFLVKGRPGLSEVLAQTVSASEAIVRTMTANLFLLPAGEPDEPGSEVFLMQPLESLLHELTSRFTYIIFDTAPVLATDDAGTLGARTHGVFMVVRAGYTSARMIRESLERLHRRKVHLLGLIYNRAGRSSDYYSKYTREYYAGVPSAGAKTGEQAKAK